MTKAFIKYPKEILTHFFHPPHLSDTTAAHASMVLFSLCHRKFVHIYKYQGQTSIVNYTKAQISSCIFSIAWIKHMVVITVAWWKLYMPCQYRSVVLQQALFCSSMCTSDQYSFSYSLCPAPHNIPASPPFYASVYMQPRLHLYNYISPLFSLITCPGLLLQNMCVPRHL